MNDLLIFNDEIDTSKNCFVVKNLDTQDTINFVCIARDVKHKNIAGSVAFCEIAQNILNKKIQLTLPRDAHYSSDKIKILNLATQSEEEKNQAYCDAHFNLLLSTQEIANGFVEGFGLTVLESALYGTPSIVMRSGGLIESVHENETGWIINQINTDEIKKVFSKKNLDDYQSVTKKCFDHTINSHQLLEWGRIFDSLCNSNKTLCTEVAA